MILITGIGHPGGNYSTVEIINPQLQITTLLLYLVTASWNYNYGNPNGCDYEIFLERNNYLMVMF
jgi:hypothetical protein